MDFSQILLALLLLVTPHFASSAPNPVTALAKRDDCAIYDPGTFNAQAADSFFLSCPGGINFALQASDANFVVYGPNSVVLWSANTGGHKRCSGTNCNYLSYQTDGNFVEYYNGKAIWSSKTAGREHSHLYFSNKRPYIYILSAQGLVAWSTGS